MSKRSDDGGAESRGTSEVSIGDEMRGERATLGRSLLDVQRDLRIKAAYIAAIENADPAVFPNPSFIPGYVRAYARYLGMDARATYARFCAESGFVGPGASAHSDHGRPVPASRAPGAFPLNFPMAEPGWGGLRRVPVSAIGSLLVLVALVGGLGYGGWTVLQNIQRVQFAPIEELPLALAEIETLSPPATPALTEPALDELARPVAATDLVDLYRRQELEVPILVPRDGPIAAIDPDRTGPLAAADAATATAAAVPTVAAASDPAPAPEDDPQLLASIDGPTLTVVAERAAWVRVYLADGTVLFERILETGETYSPPADIAGPLIWAGNSGSVFVRLGDALHGPLGSGTRAVRDVALDPAAIAERYATVAADAVPDAIQRVLDPAMAQAEVLAD